MTDSVLTRQAVRKFDSENVPEAEVLQLIAAFQAAPCGMHQTDDMQAVVVTKDEYLNKVEAATGNACYNAPLLFVISTKQDSQFGERDASAAAENIMIEANSLGLGSVYVMSAAMKLNDNLELKNDLGIDKGYDTQVIISVGYPAEKPTKEDRSNRYKVIVK